MAEKRTVVDVEALLKNGREILVILELPRDEIVESETETVFIRRPEEGIHDKHIIQRSEVAYMRRTEREEYEVSTEFVRTLGRAPVPSR